MPFEVRIAVRFLKSGKGQTILIILGIAIGVAVQIFLNSLITSLQADLLDRTIGNTPHITIKNEENLSNKINIDNKLIYQGNNIAENEGIRDYKKILNYVDEISRLTAVSPSIEKNVLAIKGEKNLPILLKGVDFKRADDIYKISKSLIEGSTIIEGNGVLVGKEFSEEMNINIDDTLYISINGSRNERLVVKGVFDLGNQSLNESWVFADLNKVQKLFDIRDEVSTIEIQVNEVFKSDAISKNIQSIFIDLKVVDWKEKNQQLLVALNSQQSSSYTIQFFVLMAIVLGISSVLAVSVVQKSKEIGILKAMGTKNISAQTIFMIQGIILGFLGSIIGSFLGMYLIDMFIRFASPDFNIDVKTSNIVFIIIVSTLSGLLSSLFPAIKSSKLEIIEVIRNG